MIRFTLLVLLLSTLLITTSSFRSSSTLLTKSLIQNQGITKHRPPAILASSTLPAMSSSSEQDSEDAHDGNDGKIVVTDLARYAIKGLSGDPLGSVKVPRGGVQTFPDDRRFALLKKTNEDKFDASDPEWLHKENFLCAFSAPELMAGFRSHYEILDAVPRPRRLLTLYRRGEDAHPVLGPIDLGLPSGRDELASFFSEASNQPLVCVTKDSDDHAFQFGNTRAGVKHNPGGDTRTVHIVNKATIRQFSEKTGLALNPMRFRPNIVIDGLKPWKEFDWVGRTLRVISSSGKASEAGEASTLIVKVLTKTVRCEGIGIDPLDPSSGKLDMPQLLSKNYPEHGPYLGVYASLEVVGGGDGGEADSGKLLSVGDTLELI